MYLRPWWLCKLRSCCSSATPSPNWSLFYSCNPLNFSCPSLHLLQYTTTAKGSGTGAPFYQHCRKHIRNLYSKKLRQTKSVRGKITLTLSALGTWSSTTPSTVSARGHLKLPLLSDPSFLSVPLEPAEWCNACATTHHSNPSTGTSSHTMNWPGDLLWLKTHPAKLVNFQTDAVHLVASRVLKLMQWEGWE